MDRAWIRSAEHRPFHAAMLITQRNLQMVDRLAVALEAEMTGFDDSGMNRPDGNLMDLFAGHLEEIDLPAGLLQRAVCLRAARKPQRLQPGMPERLDVPKLEDFPFVEMGLRAIGGERLILVGRRWPRRRRCRPTRLVPVPRTAAAHRPPDRREMQTVPIIALRPQRRQ